MNIGIIAHNAHPLKEPYQGGLEMITHLFVQTLSKMAHNVTVLCLEGSEINGSTVHYFRQDCDNILMSDPLKLLNNFTEVSKALTTFLDNDFDIVHNHSLHFLPIVMGNQLNIPFITTFHTPKLKFITKGLESIMPNINQSFTCVSESLSKIYRQDLPLVRTIYNGINVYKWKFSLHSKSNYYSWSGRICKEKGLKEAILLCEKNKLKLAIAGPVFNKEYYETEILPLLEESNYCKYLGHLNQQELNNFLKDSKAFIFSSTWQEPYGLVIAEALACGLPVIANNVGAASEILNKTCGTLFDINNEESFLNSITTAEFINREDCRKRAETFCSYETMTLSYLKLYETLITQNNHFDSILRA